METLIHHLTTDRRGVPWQLLDAIQSITNDWPFRCICWYSKLPGGNPESVSGLSYNAENGNPDSDSEYGDLTRCLWYLRGVGRKLTICCDLSISRLSLLAITRRSKMTPYSVQITALPANVFNKMFPLLAFSWLRCKRTVMSSTLV